MKVAIASSNAFIDSAAVSLAGYPRAGSAAQASRMSRKALLQIEDRAGHVCEVVLRAVLGSTLLFALGQCFWLLTQS